MKSRRVHSVGGSTRVIRVEGRAKIDRLFLIWGNQSRSTAEAGQWCLQPVGIRLYGDRRQIQNSVGPDQIYFDGIP